MQYTKHLSKLSVNNTKRKKLGMIILLNNCCTKFNKALNEHSVFLRLFTKSVMVVKFESFYIANFWLIFMGPITFTKSFSQVQKSQNSAIHNFWWLFANQQVLKFPSLLSLEDVI